jgi:hypothetical protein
VKLTALLLLAAVAGPAAAQNTYDVNSPSGPSAGPAPKSDWEIEQERREQAVATVPLPAWPKDSSLIEFKVNNMVSFRFFIDADSLSVGPDRIVRYTLVALSPSGVANVSYEGMRCADALYAIYAYGQNGRWSPRPPEWRTIELKPTQNWHHELRSGFFCPQRRGTILSAAEGLDALRRGGHPGAGARAGY